MASRMPWGDLLLKFPLTESNPPLHFVLTKVVGYLSESEVWHRSVAVVIGTDGDKVSAVAAVNDAGTGAGVSANTLVRAATAELGGKGGGKDDVAQGGGSDGTKAPAALDAARAALAAG